MTQWPNEQRERFWIRSHSEFTFPQPPVQRLSPFISIRLWVRNDKWLSFLELYGFEVNLSHVSLLYRLFSSTSWVIPSFYDVFLLSSLYTPSLTALFSIT